MSENVLASEEDAYRSWENRLKREGALDMRAQIIKALEKEILETEAIYERMVEAGNYQRSALRQGRAVIKTAKDALEVVKQQTVHNLYVPHKTAPTFPMYPVYTAPTQPSTTYNPTHLTYSAPNTVDPYPTASPYRHGFGINNFFTKDKTDYTLNLGEMLDQHRRTNNSVGGLLVECTCGEAVDDFIGHLADVRRRMS